MRFAALGFCLAIGALPVKADSGIGFFVDDIEVRVDGVVDSAETAEVREKYLGSQVSLNGFSSGDLLRITIKGEDPFVCERFKKAFTKELFDCDASSIYVDKVTLEIEKTFGRWSRATLHQIGWNPYGGDPEMRVRLIRE